MRKIGVFVLVAVLVLLGATPYLTGLWAKKQVHQLVAKAPLPPGLYLEIQNYDLGYMTSTFTLYVKMLDPAMAFEPAEIPKQQIEFLSQATINHGPIFKTKRGLGLGIGHLQGTLGMDDLIMLSEETKKNVQAYFEESELFNIEATLGFTGYWNAHFESTRVQFDDPNGTIQWGGISGEIQYSGGLHSPKNKIGILVSPLLLQSKTEHPAIVDSAEIKIYSDTAMSKEKLWVGSQTIQMPAFYLKDEQNNEIRFDHFQATSQSDIKDNLAEAQLKASAKNITFFSQKMKNIDFSMNISKLDAKSLVEFAALSNGSSNTMTNKERQALSFALIGMLSPGAEFHMNHVMNMDEGDLTATLDFVFPDLSKARDQEPPETVAQQLIMKMSATLSLAMPNTWLQDTLYRIALARLPENAPSHKDPKTGVVTSAKDALKNDIIDQLKTLSEQRIIVDDGKQYTFLLGYNQGAISLNGTLLSQEDIQKLMSVFKPQESAPQ